MRRVLLTGFGPFDGQSVNASGLAVREVAVERVAVNVIDARIPDVDGSAPVDVPVIAGAPVAFLSTLPIKACAAAVRDAGVPVVVSNSAGLYVCNATFYALQHLLAGRPGVRSGFVHVPRTPAQVEPGATAMSVDDAATAVLAVLLAALSTTVDLRVSAGTLA